MFLINKPPGPTSHDIVDIVRAKTGVRRVGHAGTLDPFARGLLIILVGKEETKRQTEFLNMDKSYEAVIRLGATSTTDDCTGEITVSMASAPAYRQAGLPLDVQNSVHSFLGSYDQLPPIYSAKKIKGKKAYELARKGEVPELKPKCVTVHSIEVTDYSWPLLSLRCLVSSGTYIRALARDIGQRLGCGAYVEKLTRTRIGPYSLSNALSPDDTSLDDTSVQ